MRRSKTYHNGISPPSLGRKMKFFPKVLSMEEAMMDGGKYLREQTSFFISALQLKCDAKCFSPRRRSTTVFTSLLKLDFIGDVRYTLSYVGE